MDTTDAEINALKTMASVLSPLDEQARIRVVNWVVDRFGLPLGEKRQHKSAPQSTSGAEVEHKAPGGETDLPTFFAETSPETESDKALVVAYWLQTSQGKDSFDSQSVNTELKQLGHGVKNITQALSGLIELKPQLVIQLKKSGTSRQARKTFRVTAVGAAKVKQLMNQAQGN